MKLRFLILIMFPAVMSKPGILQPTQGALRIMALALPQATRIEARPEHAGSVLPGRVGENPKDGLQYVWIPPGDFMMGCPPGDTECFDQEKPPHHVKITKGFWIGQTEVTVAAYKRFAGGTGKAMPPTPDFNMDWNDEQMPIVNLSWDDAQAYCTWAGGRLPSEAEWEYAARAGSAEARYGPVDEVAWYYVNSDLRPHPVGGKRANGFGLYDVLGNVWEWVNDWYDENYYQQSPSQDPRGPASGLQHVLRGGSWGGFSKYARLSERIRGFPGGRRGFNGFRCGGDVLKP
jgi:sulfatase modifying factor 1